ncbi:MAG: YopT-type cysteine protease domain-containing protein [Pirellulaceae bacterium]
MPYYFTCPKCNGKNYGYRNAPTGSSYYDNNQCTQCGEKGLFWVANEQTANRLTQQLGTPRTKIAVGATESSIPYMDPQVATGNTAKVLSRITAHATLVAPYSQGERCKAFTPTVTAVGEGQCAGQCLHWIRRVLQGGREVYLVPREKNGATRTDQQLVNKQKKQHLIGAKTQVMLDRAKQDVPEQRIAEIDRRIQEFLRSRGITLVGDQWQVTSSSPAERTLKMNLIRQAESKRDALVEKMNREGIFSYGWTELARELDGVVDRHLGGSKRSFSNILAVKCVNRRDGTFGSGQASSFANAVINDGEFLAGRCAMLSVGLRVGIGEGGGSISGHAIACHFKSPGELYIFDPNLGIFQCTSKDKCRQALTALMGEAWTRDLGWQLQGTFGYAIFRANRTVEPSRPGEREVDLTVSEPRPTTFRNLALGTIPTSPSTTAPVMTSSTPTTTGTGGGTTPQFAPQSSPQQVGSGNTGGTRGGRVAELARRFAK